MNKAYKFRIYPNKEQQEFFAKTFGCVRFIYNKMLADKIKYYNETGKNLYCYPSQYKTEFEWLKEVDSLALVNADNALKNAYNNFFKRPKIGFPKFKSKKINKNSYTTNNQKENIRIEDGRLKLPKIGWVKLKQHRPIPDNYKLKSVTISQTPTGKYFASILFEYDKQIEPVKISKEKVVAIHYKNKDLFLDSEGFLGNYPRYYNQSLDNLKRQQRKLSKMKKGSRNSEKQRIKVAKIHEKIANQRKDFLHKLSCEYSKSYDAVFVDGFDMQKISQTHNLIRLESEDVENKKGIKYAKISKDFRLGKTTTDNSFGMFRTFLSYKLIEQGKKYIETPKDFLVSKTCNACGMVNESVTLNKITWTCTCGQNHDREYNAVQNVLKYGLEQLNLL